MRRLIAYITMALATLISVGVSFNLVFSKMNPGREFTSGREIVYNIASKDESSSLKSGAVDEVAEEMRDRLDKMNVEDYSLKVEGEDTIVVTIANNDDTQFNYIARYLSFSGGDFSLSGKDEETRKNGEDIFGDKEAYITRVNDVFPYVIFPVEDSEVVKNLIEAVKPEEGGDEPASAKILRADEDGEGEQQEPDIFLWANWEEGDSYEKAEKDPAVTGKKILCSFISSNIWYENSEEEETELAFLCGFSNTDGEYDTTKLKQANQMANYICNMFNATEYEVNVENLLVSQSASGETINSISVNASAVGGESLLVFGNEVNVALSYTLIATLVALGVVSLLFVVFYRLSALAAICNSVGTVFLTYVVFMAMHAVFNVAALVGGIILAGAANAASIMYLHKFKEEVKKGRALKKANQEAAKKTLMFVVDIAVILAFAGLMLYVLGGTALKPMGIVLFFGALFVLAMNLIIFRFMMHLLCNASAIVDKPNLLNIEPKEIASPMEANEVKEEKQVADYTRHKKPVGIVALLLTIASVAGIITFGVINGSPLNVSSASKDTTSIYALVEGDKLTVDNEEAFKNYVLKNVFVDDKEITYKSENGVSHSERVLYNYETELETKYEVFIVNMDYELTDANKFAYKDAGGEMIPAESVEEALKGAIQQVEGESSADYITVSQKRVTETVYTPNQGFVALATGIAIAGAALYAAFRYRPSRGLALGLVSASATAAGYGIFVLARIGTTAVASLGMPIIAVTTLLAGLFYLNKEKDILREEKGDLSLEKRSEVMVKALAVSAIPLLYFVLIAVYIAINYFGFGLASYAYLFGSALVGIILGTIYVLILMGPIGSLFEKLFSKIKLPQFKRSEKKAKIKLQNKPKTSEPQETIFIGIND